MDVICEGVLDLGSKPSSSSSKDWKSRLCVLHHHKETRLTTLEYYKDTRKRWQKQVPIGVVSLVPSFELSLAHNCSYQFPIKLVDGKGQTFYLSAKTFPEMNMWYNCLQRQRLLEQPTQGYHEYVLNPKESQSMTLIGATGLSECILSFTPKREIICADAQNRQVLGVWPFSSLRRYWRGDGMFGFEAGRRSPRGEGLFEFATSQGDKLYKKLDTLTKANSPKSSKALDTRPPVPLPSAPTPPVSSASDSDEEISSSNQSSTTKEASNTVEVSGTSPAYHTQNVPSRGHRYLHETVQPESESQRKEEIRNPNLPPPPAALRGEHIATSDPGIDDTYSHTVHKVPEHFQHKAMEHSAVSGGFYNALVHRHSSASIKLKSRNGSDSDELVYDVAFQPTSVKRVVMPVTQDGEYAIAHHPKSNTWKHTSTTRTTTTTTSEQQRTLDPTGRYVITEPVENKEIDNPLYRSKEDLTDAGVVDTTNNDNGMLDNPLYGSKENLFSNEQSKELEAHVASSVTLKKEDHCAGVNGNHREFDDSLTVNPIYGITGNFKPVSSTEQKVPVEQTASSEMKSSTTDLQTGQMKSGEESPQSQVEGAVTVGSDSPTEHREATPDTIQRDAKGYSKIDKNKKTKSSNDNKQTREGPEDGSGDELPPPIPPRNYSIDGESPPQTMEERQEQQ